ncbi:MAG: tyrosine-protein phosphatase [Eggerthellaceae bacterium]|nr:tyrosine-protein phosphatase [Eggerthellaceae bacterium]
MRAIELQGADNVRDLGGIPAGDGRIVAPGLMYRGSALHKLTDDDRRTLFGELGIACIVDVRCGWEREAKPDAVADGVENLHIPFYDLEKVGIEYTEPAEGTKVVGRDVACNPERFYRSLANPLTVRQMRNGVHQVFGHAMSGHPVYIHCSGGKDRAGILSLLVLTVLGVSREDILEDYLLTNIDRDRNFEKTFQRFMKFSGNELKARELVHSHRARPENLEAFYEEIDDRYGSMSAFIRNQLGISDAERANMRSTCTRLQVEAPVG